MIITFLKFFKNAGLNNQIALSGFCLLFPVKQPLACARTRTLSLTTYILTYSCSKLFFKQSLLMLMGMKNSFRNPL